MQGLTHRWNLPESKNLSPDQGESLGLGLEPLVCRFLESRGLNTPSAAAAFCDPQLATMHDPSALPGLDQAAGRILDAARAGEPIVIYGDYDVDGMTATAILFHLLHAVTPQASVSTYVPHRLDEGYGLNTQALESLCDQGARLIISVDCGITALEPARVVRARGVDLIITDHHLVAADGVLPEAHSIVHPGLPGSDYPFADLCGAGVAFKLAWRIATLAEGSERVGSETRELLLDLLALAALGTIADVVPLEDENRVIARFGLRRLRTTTLIGVQALLQESGLAGARVDAEQVGFILAPRLNAIGRLGHAQEATELLTTTDRARAGAIARELARLNDQRKRTETKMTEQAMSLAESGGMTSPDRRAIVLAHESWHAGVVGICCSRLVGRFHRPTILLTREDGRCTGSGRSVDGFDLCAALDACAEHLTTFGGHAMAAGLTLEESRLEAFIESFTSVANLRLREEDLTPSLDVDCEARLVELSPLASRQLQDLGPYGRGNPSPRILVRGVRIARAAEPFGARGAHLGIPIAQDGCALRLIAWRWGQREDLRLPGGATIDAIIEPKLNSWNGRTSVEPVVRDLRVHG